MLFAELFSNVRLDEKILNEFNDVEVVKCINYRKSKLVHFELNSPHFIKYASKKKAEEVLTRKVTGSTGCDAKLDIYYHLSERYKPQDVYEAINDDIHDELNDIDKKLYAMYISSKFKFDGSRMIIQMIDSKLLRHFSDEYTDYLDKIYNNRCGVKTDIEIEYIEEQRDLTGYTVCTVEDSGSMGVKGGQAYNEKKKNDEEKNDEEKNDEEKNDKVKNDREKNDKEKNDKVKNGREKSFEKKGQAYGDSGTHFSKSGFRHKNFDKFDSEPDPDLIYGRRFDGDIIPIHEITDERREVLIRGKIIKYEDRTVKSGRLLVMFVITDLSDSITVKIFADPEQQKMLADELAPQKYVIVKGVTMFDSFSKETALMSVVGIKRTQSFEILREDNAPTKRVELHLHTSYSDMDGMTNPADIVKTAKRWGHSAVAITDHGVVQAFPVAFHEVRDHKDKYNDFKIIYGMEAYLVDDMVMLVRNAGEQDLKCPAVVFDIETTGFSNEKNRIIEIGAVKLIDGKITEKFSTFVNPGVPIPYRIQELTSINDQMVDDAPDIKEVLPKFLDFVKGCILVAHNANFDVGFIRKNAADLGIENEVPRTYADTMEMARLLLPSIKNYKLDTVAEILECSLENHHRAVDDAGCTADIYIKLLEKFESKGIKKIKELNGYKELDTEVIKKMRPYHAIILCKNNIGRVNLYHLVTDSNLKYMSNKKKPLVPKSNILKHRDGLILGSACEQGELFQAVARNAPMEEIKRIADFYDYFEIQPLGNNRFMIDSDEYAVSGDDDLIDLNKRIIRLGDELGKLTVATCDVHFLNPEDEIYRRVLQYAKGFDDADRQPPLYYRTTEEMLHEFEYLGIERATEVVITNTNRIADMIEKIDPVRPDKCPPVIPNSDEILTKICYETAHKQYGPNLPKPVEDRLKHELDSIIKNGFAVMYIIAQKLVWKSNEDGYLVGSRGSVGSSFVANMSGITEVNSLAPHYYCPNCHFADFDSPEVVKYSMLSGCDMPDRICPKCGKMLNKDGHNIPFETFLGFNGDKEPDIDLNFSGEYQSKAHAYTEVIFGHGQTFRAGTIEAVADKTAYGYVLKYNEGHGITMRNEEVERISLGCIGVRTTTGQHPGGIVVMPIGEDINTFTPVQHPPKDETHITTHFEYHSIDHNLLKLDILGHDDPTMIRFLEDITGVDAKAIRFDDKKVLSLFESTAALGVTSADIDDVPLGSLGIPEMGTNFVIQMLVDTKPKSFSDLIRISGLSHGTDVWLGNVQELIRAGKCTLQTAICTRDDIMTGLINQYHLENGHAFKIMEAVRKGKGLKDDWMEPEMIEHGVPDWYIWSCKKIGYMFPKAHACAYVMMALRIAYFKVYYPLAYYAAYFSIRAKAFDYEKMALGRDKLLGYMNEYKNRRNSGDREQKLTASEDNQYDDMRIVLEMYARGYKFQKIDLHTVNANTFKIIDDRTLMPALSTVAGIGGIAADQIIKAFNAGKFVSQEDFANQGKVGQKTLEVLDKLGMMGGLPKTSQMSLFDLIQ